MKKPTVITKLITTLICTAFIMSLLPQRLLAQCTQNVWIPVPGDSICDCPSGNCTSFIDSIGGYQHCTSGFTSGNTSCSSQTQIVVFKIAPCISSFNGLDYAVCVAGIVAAGVTVAACYDYEDGIWIWDSGECKTAIAALVASGILAIPACQHCALYSCSYDPTAENLQYGYQSTVTGNPCGPG
jgi:hypothetical protein